jgi:uncharacterized repeat protein (TIGR02543 family)
LLPSPHGPVLELAAASTVTVEDDGNGTGSANPPAALPDTLITLDAVPDHGYTFKEWQVVSGGVNISTPTSPTATFTMPDSNVTVKAVFAATSTPTKNITPTQTPTIQPVGGDGNMEDAFRVLFDTKGGNSIPPATGLSYGDRVPRPADPTRDGYTFSGWYLDETGTKAWNFADTILGDMTLYAKWVSVATSTETPTPTITQTVQPTASEPTGQPTKQPTIEPQPTGNEGNEPAGSILPLLGGILMLILALLLILILLLRHTVTLLVPAAGGIERYRIHIWHGRYIDQYDLPELFRTADWYTDQERRIRWDFDEDQVKKSMKLYLG